MDGATIPLSQPAHVPDHLVFDFDIYKDSRLNHDVQGSYAKALEDAPDIFWTRLNGGHWIIKGFDAISEVVRDPEHFSVREMQIPRVENPPFFIPLSLDPPENLPYRQAMVPMFGPVAVKTLEPSIREWAAKIIDGVVAKGECDFQGEVSKLFPVTVFMELMGMDLARLPEFRKLAEDFFDNQNNAAELARLGGEIMGVLGGLIAEKTANPDGDEPLYSGGYRWADHEPGRDHGHELCPLPWRDGHGDQCHRLCLPAVGPDAGHSEEIG